MEVKRYQVQGLYGLLFRPEGQFGDRHPHLTLKEGACDTGLESVIIYHSEILDEWRTTKGKMQDHPHGEFRLSLLDFPSVFPNAHRSGRDMEPKLSYQLITSPDRGSSVSKLGHMDEIDAIAAFIAEIDQRFQEGLKGFCLLETLRQSPTLKTDPFISFGNADHIRVGKGSHDIGIALKTLMKIGAELRPGRAEHLLTVRS